MGKNRSGAKQRNGQLITSLTPPDERAAKRLKSDKPARTYEGDLPEPPKNKTLARDVSLVSLTPLLNCVIYFFEEWQRDDGCPVPFHKMQRWLGEVVVEMWFVIHDAPFRAQIWLTVQQNLSVLFDWSKFDFSAYGLGRKGIEVSLLMPAAFFRPYASLETNVLEAFQNFKFRILTGQ